MKIKFIRLAGRVLRITSVDNFSFYFGFCSNVGLTPLCPIKKILLNGITTVAPTFPKNGERVCDTWACCCVCVNVIMCGRVNDRVGGVSQICMMYFFLASYNIPNCN